MPIQVRRTVGEPIAPIPFESALCSGRRKGARINVADDAAGNDVLPKRNWTLPFFGIWAGQAVSLVGSRVAQFGLVWWLTESTGSATVLATATLAALLPGIVLGPIVGVLVDRWNRRWVMIAADGLIALAALWLAFMFWAGRVQVWHIYLLMLLRSIGEGFHWPAMHASTSLMVPEEHLTRVAGLNQALNGALNVVGPPLGALFLRWLPFEGVMLLDVVTALLAIVPLLSVAVPQPKRDTLAEGLPSVWADLLEGLRYVRAWPGLVALIIAALIFKIALTPAFSLIPLMVSEYFGGGPEELSLLESVMGIGILLGGVLLGLWGGFRRRIYTMLLSASVLCVAFVVFGLLPSNLFSAAVATAGVMGLMIPLADGPLMAILQANVAPEIQARVFTLLGSLISLSSPLGLALAGPVADWLGLQTWYLAAGALLGLTVVGFYFTPAIMNIEQNQGRGGVER
jgi:DHA3 family macrolide efflux protein-like MFS transporter